MLIFGYLNSFPLYFLGDGIWYFRYIFIFFQFSNFKYQILLKPKLANSISSHIDFVNINKGLPNHQLHHTSATNIDTRA